MHDHIQSDDRRRFLTTTALGTAAWLALGRPVRTQELDLQEATNVNLVNAFCASWSTRDLAAILPHLAETTVYRMSETTPPVTGHAGIEERLGSWLESSEAIEFNVLESFAKGPIVVNHRIDRFISTTRPLTWEGVGVFFIRNDLIQEWQDFTIRVDGPGGEA